MKHFSKTIVAMTMAAGLFAVQAPAFAAPTLVGADAILILDDFIFTATDANNVKHQVSAGTDITLNGGNNNGNTFAALDGVADFHSGNSALGASMMITPSIVGVPAAGFTPYFAAPGSYGAGTNETATARSELVGSAISGLSTSSPATASTRATSGLEDALVGDATSNIGLNVTFDFIANGTFDLGFETGYDWTAYTFLDPTVTGLGAIAQASTSWSITLSEVVPGASGPASTVTPFELQHTFSSLNPGEFQGGVNVTGNIAYIIGTVEKDKRYTLNIRHTTEVDVGRGEIPEPGILALLGLGFLGMTFVSRRRLAV